MSRETEFKPDYEKQSIEKSASQPSFLFSILFIYFFVLIAREGQRTNVSSRPKALNRKIMGIVHNTKVGYE